MQSQLTADGIVAQKRISSGRKPIECLGMRFETDADRRAYFLTLLANKLEEPSFRALPGFPDASDDDILRLSDPPFYTACPNPFLADATRESSAKRDERNVEAFAGDISGDKHGAMYNVHPYHTKVPPEAIAPLIEHYSKSGDVILDPFAGTGMMGVAAQNLSDGPRTAILIDISPIAAFIAATYTSPAGDRGSLLSDFDSAIASTAAACARYYQTAHTGWPASTRREKDAITRPSSRATPRGQINYVVWSEIQRCPACSVEFSYWDAAVRLFDCVVEDTYDCPSCSAKLCKEERFEKKHGATVVERVVEAWFDPILGEVAERPKRVPVLINYIFGNKRFEKTPDAEDLALVAEADRVTPEFLPQKMMTRGAAWGDTWRAGYHSGITHAHQFFTNRNLHAIGKFLGAAKDRRTWFAATASMLRLSRLNRYMPQHRDNKNREVVGPLSGTLYVPSLSLEVNPLEYLSGKRNSMEAVWSNQAAGATYCSTQSATNLSAIGSESVDYIFTDPPFGDNLPYSELNFIWESTLRCRTSSSEEAIVSPSQGKDIKSYSQLMTRALSECHRVLKPGRWITIEFHNSKNEVWNSLNEAIEAAGFVVADVKTLDKKKGTTKQLTFANAVKQDLVISAYKPSKSLSLKVAGKASADSAIWEFVEEHLSQLPVFIGSTEAGAQIITERLPYMLFNRMVAFHVRRGIEIPLTAADFYSGLSQRWIERDGMYFSAAQAAAYDKKRITVRELQQTQLSITDEVSAIQWLRQQLSRKPQTFQELHTAFLKESAGWQKHEAPMELSDLLEQNFLLYGGEGPVPAAIHAYLSTNFRELRNLEKDNPALRSKAKSRWYVPDAKNLSDLERLRERALLKEFATLTAGKGRIKQLRMEACRMGFKKLWEEGDYRTIVAIASRLSPGIVEEDSWLLMYTDLASSRVDR